MHEFVQFLYTALKVYIIYVCLVSILGLGIVALVIGQFRKFSRRF